MAQDPSDANGRGGFVQVKIPYTWVNCSRAGYIDVRLEWIPNPNKPLEKKIEQDRIYYTASDKPEGKTFTFALPDWGPNVIYERVIVSVPMDNSSDNVVIFDHYEPYVILAPNPCSASNGCKRISEYTISCPGGGGGDPD